MTSSASQPPGGWAAREVSTAAPSWRVLRLVASMTVLAFAGFGASGCSFSYQLGSMFGKDNDKVAEVAPKPDITSATKISPTAAKPEEGSKITDADLAAASVAAAQILASGIKDASAPWQNPETGARGMVTPLASVHTQDGFTCRDFLASVVREDAEAWLQGEACRVHHGQWVVRSLKPWKRA
ncbi:MAG: RT0821/Lpp0805 family surface protein [Xanthobacteraceae bacterium]